MKWIIDDVTYNTETATVIARNSFADDDEGKAYERTLYQTRGGAFFLHTYSKWDVRKDHGWVERESDECDPMTQYKAQEWMTKEGDVEVVNNVFGDPPEAAAETTASATIYLRVPVVLKGQLEKKARAAGQSLNAWAMRCLEKCADESK